MNCIFDNPKHPNGGCIFDNQILVVQQDILGSTGLFDPRAEERKRREIERLEKAAEEARRERAENRALLRQELTASIIGKPEQVETAITAVVEAVQSPTPVLSVEQANALAQALAPVKITQGRDYFFEWIDSLAEQAREFKRKEREAVEALEALYEEEALFLLMA